MNDVITQDDLSNLTDAETLTKEIISKYFNKYDKHLLITLAKLSTCSKEEFIDRANINNVELANVEEAAQSFLDEIIEGVIISLFLTKMYGE